MANQVKCEYCEKEFDSLRGLKIHVKKAHPEYAEDFEAKLLLEELDKQGEDFVMGDVKKKNEGEVSEDELAKLEEENEQLRKAIMKASENQASTLARKYSKNVKVSTKALLMSEEKVEVFIPIDPLNKKINYIRGSINGVPFIVARGKTVEVAKSIAEVVNGWYRGTVNAEQKMEENASVEIKGDF